MSKRLKQIYSDMKTRCYNSNSRHFKWYGARGITICSEWLNSERTYTNGRGRPPTKGWIAFESWARANGYSDDLTLDRIDVNKGYYPDNCRWTTMKEQENNKTKGVRHITYKGQTKNIVEWSKELNIPYSSLWIKLLHNNWNLDNVMKETKL